MDKVSFDVFEHDKVSKHRPCIRDHQLRWGIQISVPKASLSLGKYIFPTGSNRFFSPWLGLCSKVLLFQELSTFLETAVPTIGLGSKSLMCDCTESKLHERKPEKGNSCMYYEDSTKCDAAEVNTHSVKCLWNLTLYWATFQSVTIFLYEQA